MADMEMIEQELRQFLEQEPNLSKQDRFVYLKAIFDKHFAMEKTDHLLTSNDFNAIISYAKSQFIHTNLPLRITKKEVYPSEVPQVLMIESVIRYLNGLSILRKIVKFDYTR